MYLLFNELILNVIPFAIMTNKKANGLIIKLNFHWKGKLSKMTFTFGQMFQVRSVRCLPKKGMAKTTIPLLLCLGIKPCGRLVCKLSLDELTVQAGDVGDRLVLRALCLAGTSVGTVTESELFHLHTHCLCAFCSFRTALWQQCEL